MSTPRVFITGVTGYIGGAILVHYLNHHDTKNYSYSALVRSLDHAAKLPEHVQRVIGDLDSAEVITKAAGDADLILHCANSDHLPSANAIVAGMIGKKNILVQTSGTGILVDDSKGGYESKFVYSDLDMKSIHDVPVTQPHRNVDSFLFDSEVSDRVIIVCPPVIYGLGSGEKKISQQIPGIINASLRTKKIQSIGPGLNVWNHVHIEDLAELYVLIGRKSLSGEISGGKNDGFYFCESGEHRWIEIYRKLAEIFYKKGITASADVETLTSDQVILDTYGKYAFMALGSNSRCSADRARKIGWKPSRESLFDTLEKEVEYHRLALEIK